MCLRNEIVYKKNCYNTSNNCKICLPGYKDTGKTCTLEFDYYFKKSYTRDMGESLICDCKEEYDSGLCYPQCINGSKGVGSTCWFSCNYSSTNPSDCGVLCTTDASQCTQISTAAASAGIKTLTS